MVVVVGGSLQHFSVSTRPLGFGFLGFWVWGLGVWGLGLTISVLQVAIIWFLSIVINNRKEIVQSSSIPGLTKLDYI